jgi:hypothetical protein
MFLKTFFHCFLKIDEIPGFHSKIFCYYVTTASMGKMYMISLERSFLNTISFTYIFDIWSVNCSWVISEKPFTSYASVTTLSIWQSKPTSYSVAVLKRFSDRTHEYMPKVSKCYYSFPLYLHCFWEGTHLENQDTDGKAILEKIFGILVVRIETGCSNLTTGSNSGLKWWIFSFDEQQMVHNTFLACMFVCGFRGMSASEAICACSHLLTFL